MVVAVVRPGPPELTPRLANRTIRGRRFARGGGPAPFPKVNPLSLVWDDSNSGFAIEAVPWP